MSTSPPATGEILIIDDETGVRMVLARHLGEAGHRVSTTGSLTTGVAMLQGLSFDLVYCDIRLSGQSGLDLLQESHSFAGTPLIIMMTGYPSLETTRQALRQGAFDYLVKPILADTLLRSAALAIDARRKEEERKRLHHHLEAVFDSVEDGLISLNPALTLVAVNRSANRLCGILPGDAGRSLSAAQRRCSGSCLVFANRAMTEGGKVDGKRLTCFTNGEVEQVVSVTATPMRTRLGELLGVIMAMHDETHMVRLERCIDRHHRFHRLIGGSPAMREIYRLVETLADLETTVLILGESGTGKELVIEAIHGQGRRRGRPLVKVNCVALSETVLESELFGHVRGSFTGAVKDRIGRFQEAEGGTLFLDEIGDISQVMQLRLLRVLQEKRIERVGDNRSIPVDVRIIAATNQDLRAKVAAGTFREDLFYRLKVVEIEIPPLRSRAEDIPMLVEHFLSGFNARFHKTIHGLSPEAMAALMNHGWPGNIRELEHALEQAMVLCRGEVIEREHLPRELRGNADPERTRGKAPVERAQSAEREAILAALAACNWRREQAARRLGMSRVTLFRKMRQLGMNEREVKA
ncbi:MAG: sigma 54-interacting transcriptional regulator [Magnetococcales bacterium]|nr:sigma 54-interacting transcriptional regulator [Magnetococcales bacterium]